jgi:hypothetical protein
MTEDESISQYGDLELPDGVHMMLLQPMDNGTVTVYALMDDGSVVETNVPVCNIQDFVCDGNSLNPYLLDKEV